MDPVQDQVDAFNARDIDRFVRPFAPDVTAEDGAGNVTLQGQDALRTVYGPIFAQSPNLRVRIAHRIRVGAYVVDEEYVTGLNLAGVSPDMHGVAIYRVADDRIVHMRLLT